MKYKIRNKLIYIKLCLKLTKLQVENVTDAQL